MLLTAAGAMSFSLMTDSGAIVQKATGLCVGAPAAHNSSSAAVGPHLWLGPCSNGTVDSQIFSLEPSIELDYRCFPKIDFGQQAPSKARLESTSGIATFRDCSVLCNGNRDCRAITYAADAKVSLLASIPWVAALHLRAGPTCPYSSHHEGRYLDALLLSDNSSHLCSSGLHSLLDGWQPSTWAIITVII